MDNVDVNGVQILSELKDGKEHPDPTPMAPPVGMERELTMNERIRMMVRNAVSEHAASKDMETFEEADDFDIPDDPVDPRTPYEAVFDPAPEVQAKAPGKGVEPPSDGPPAPPKEKPADASPAAPPAE